MKKQLLLAMAVASFATVSAQQTVSMLKKNAALTSVKTEESVMVESAQLVESAVVDRSSANFAAAASDYTPLPFYTVDGMFYDSWIVSGANANKIYTSLQFAYLPPFADITYQGGSSYYLGTLPGTPAFNWTSVQLTSYDFTTGDAQGYNKTGSGMTYASGFKTLYLPEETMWPTTLDMDGVKYHAGSSFTHNGEVYDCAFQYGGRRGSVGSDGEFEEISLTYFPRVVTQSYDALDSYYGVSTNLYLSNMALNGEFKVNTNSGPKTFPISIAQILRPSQYGVYGFDKVYLNFIVDNVSAGGKFVMNIYEIASEDDEADYYADQVIPGKLLASGYVSTDEYVGNSNLIAIPVIDVEGEGQDAIENLSFFNVTKPVIVVVSLESASGSADSVFPKPIFALGDNKSRLWTFKSGGVFFHNCDLGSDGVARDVFFPRGATSLTNGMSFMQLGWDISFGIRYSYLYNDGVYPELSYDAPAAGGEQKFAFTPAEDLYDAKITVSDNQNWVFVYPDADLAADGKQELVVEVDALPAGVSGRSAVVTVEVQGAIQTIAVKQGDTSGIDTIEGDNANVVSSQIFDLQGRQLNAVPENGLYIRRDVKADNTVTTTKVVK